MYIRPSLEYCSVVWAPYTKRNIDKLEAVQRRAARFVTSNYSYTSSVTAMMETLNWNTLHARRNILRLIMFYTIWLISLYQNLLLLQPLLITQEVTIYLSAESMHTSTCSFFPATMNLWNELPHHIANATTINSFCDLATY